MDEIEQVQELADNQHKIQATQSTILEKLNTLSKQVAELTTKAKVPVTPVPISSWDVEDTNNETWNMDNEWSWNIESEEEISPDTFYMTVPLSTLIHTHIHTLHTHITLPYMAITTLPHTYIHQYTFKHITRTPLIDTSKHTVRQAHKCPLCTQSSTASMS